MKSEKNKDNTLKNNVKWLVKKKNTRLKILKFFRFFPDKMMIKLEYLLSFNKKLNLKNPKKYTEKLQYLKLYDRKPEYTRMVDKLEAKEFIREKVGDKYVVPLIGAWDSFDDIDFSKLPNEFVLKCNHDSGSVIICTEKSSLDLKKARKNLMFHLGYNWYIPGREWPYKNVKRKIIAEKLLSSDGKDYKFFCFDGVARVMYISNDIGDDPRTDFFDMDFNHLPIRMRDPNADITPSKPLEFSEMKMVAEKLSQGIPQLRVDFYVADGRVYIGELTFFHNSGFSKIYPMEWDYILGDWINLDKIKNIKKA